MKARATDRRTQILDVAEELFTRKGYLDTGIAELIAALDIARGTFYHHFASKEEVMLAVIDRHVDTLVAATSEIAARTDVSATERLLLCLGGEGGDPAQNAALTDEIERTGNELMHLIAMNTAIRALTPVFAAIIADGAAAGEFRVADAEATAAAFLTVTAHLVDDDLLGWVAAADVERLSGLLAVAEQLLGAAPGVLSPLTERLSPLTEHPKAR